MPVIETPSSNSDDIFVRIERRKKGDRVTGRQRKGFNSRSGMLAMTDKEIGEIECPTVDKSPTLIKHLRIIGKERKGERPEDVLTAQGAALYEFLMASARLQGMDQVGEYRVSFEDAKKYLEIEHNARLTALADQLRETKVEYDFRLEGFDRWGRMPLLFTDFGRDRDGKMFIIYSVHNAVKRVMMERDSYTKLEINAFAKFSCKYTARIYPRLAMMAGYHPAYRKPWKITPIELAKLIGFTFSGEFHYGNFEKGCLKKVMHDIEEHVYRFHAHVVVHRKPGRGNPVDYLEFTTSSTEKHVAEHSKRPMSPEQYKELNSQLKGDETQFFGEMPSAELLRIGATKTGYTPTELLAKWKETIPLMHAYPNISLPGAGLLKGQKILDMFFSHGIGPAFELWLSYLDAKLQKVVPVRKTDTIHDQILRIIIADDEMAMCYCDPEHPEWKKLAGGLGDWDKAAFQASLKIMAKSAVDPKDRRTYFEKLVALIKSTETDKLSAAVGQLSDLATRKYRKATPA